MIYFSGLGSIIESIYLGERLGENRKECKIFVNPENITYLAYKVVIVNSLRYPLYAIKELLRNKNKVVQRVACGERIEGVSYNPYLLRPTFDVMWNGMVVDGKGWQEENWEVESLEVCYWSPEDYKLYFPKITSLRIPCHDSYGSLTPLGWLLHQVGQETDPTSPWRSLDLLKTYKMQL